jgi:hypothetical protein
MTEEKAFDPFDERIPGSSVSERLRYLFLKVVIKDGDEWRTHSDAMKVIALQSLYAAMVGFNKNNLSLLYPSGIMGDEVETLLLTKSQQTDEPSVRDRCCGHAFEKGETYYRCRYDSSLFCVLIQTMLQRSDRRHLWAMLQHPGSHRSFVDCSHRERDGRMLRLRRS